MSKTRILVVLLLAFTILLPVAEASLGSLGLFNFPAIQVPSYNGNAQISNNQIGTSPIIFAPPSSLLLTGGYTGNHFMPRLETSTWTSSMKTSPINGVLALMSKMKK